MVDFDYTISDNITEQTPKGFIAIDRCEEGEPVERIADIYGTDEGALELANEILKILSLEGSVALIYPEVD